MLSQVLRAGSSKVRSFPLLLLRSSSLAARNLRTPRHSTKEALAGFSTAPWYDFADLDVKNVSQVPRLPIPAFEDTIRKYLLSARALCASDEDFAQHAQLVNDFATGVGLELDKRLRERDAEQAQRGGYPFSYIEAAWDAGYLEARCPNPVNINPSYILELPQLDKTASTHRFTNLARFALGAVSWHHKVLAGKLDRDGGAVCFSVFGKQLGAARIPAPGRDELKFHPHSRHAVVFCGSSVYKVNLLNEQGEVVPEASLAAVFQSISDKENASEPGSPSPPIALFTAGDRDDWAQTRSQLRNFDANNAATVDLIDSALLSIAIDGPSSSTAPEPSALSSASLLGNTHGGVKAQPRWFDKHQLLSLETGEIGYNFEHSYSDGMSWNRMISEVSAHVQGQAPPKGCSPLESLPTQSNGCKVEPEKLHIKLDTDLEGKLVAAQTSFAATIDNLDNKVVDFTEFGKSEIKTWRHSPDAVVQLALIMAFAKLDAQNNGSPGKLPGVYEACSVSTFFHGRTETIRSMTEPAATFVRAIQDTNHAANKDTLRGLLTSATGVHRTNSVEAAGAGGIDRHLLALQLLAAEEGLSDQTALFSDPLFQQSKRWLLSTSNVTADFIRYFAFGAVEAQGYGIGYMINNDKIPMNISSYRDSGVGTNSTEYGEAVRESLLTLRDIAAPGAN